MKTAKQILFTLILISVIAAPVYSQLLFVDNFNYPVTDSLEHFGGWVPSGSDTPYDIKIKSPGLTYTGYNGSGIGNCVFLSNDYGDIVSHSFLRKTSGSVYLSALIRVDSLSIGGTNGFDICLDEYGGPTNLNTKLFIKKLTTSTFNFGIMKSDSLPLYSNTVYSSNITYMIVMKYTFVPGVRNDSAKLYVISTGVPATEPASPSIFEVNGSDVSDIGEVVISNSYAGSELKKSSVRIDGIRIAASWTDVIFANLTFHLNLTAFLEGLYSDVTGKMTKDTATVYLRYGFAPYAIVDSSKSILDSTGKGNFTFKTISNNNAYYIAVKHRNSIETWSAVAWEFYNENMTYEFVSSSAQAYGNNLVQKNYKYCLYSGDVNQDGFINLADVISVSNDASNFVSGYKKTDLTGDGIVNLTDLILAYNNSTAFVSKIRP